MLIDTTNREPKTDPATDPGHGRHGIVPKASNVGPEAMCVSTRVISMLLSVATKSAMLPLFGKMRSSLGLMVVRTMETAAGKSTASVRAAITSSLQVVVIFAC